MIVSKLIFYTLGRLVFFGLMPLKLILTPEQEILSFVFGNKLLARSSGDLKEISLGKRNKGSRETGRKTI